MSRARILIVDDIKKNHDVLIELLREDYDLLPALNADNALKILDKKEIDLILLDVMMPEIDGFALCEIIKAYNKTKDIPIIFITARTDEDSIEKAYELGGVDYVTKPFKPKELFAKIKKELKIQNLIYNLELSNRESIESKKKVELLNADLEIRVKEEVEKNREQQLMMFQQNRLAQMGEMISMIAHQWRQPLNNLSLLTQTIVLKYQRNRLSDKTIEYFNSSSRKQIKQMSTTIDDFRDFFKPEKEKKSFDLSQSLSHAVNIVSPILSKEKITLTLSLCHDCIIDGYSNELEQSIINILNNAKDALIENRAEDRSIEVTLTKDTAFANLTICDNAGGISEENIDKIFDPYFSTKETKQGTGLGLYMSKMIIQKHKNANLSVSNIDNGAKFEINLER